MHLFAGGMSANGNSAQCQRCSLEHHNMNQEQDMVQYDKHIASKR